MKIKYIGSLSEGELFDRDAGRTYRFKQGETIEVDDKFGKRLTMERHGVWCAVTPPRKPPKVKEVK